MRFFRRGFCGLAAGSWQAVGRFTAGSWQVVGKILFFSEKVQQKSRFLLYSFSFLLLFANIASKNRQFRQNSTGKSPLLLADFILFSKMYNAAGFLKPREPRGSVPAKPRGGAPANLQELAAQSITRLGGGMNFAKHKMDASRKRQGGIRTWFR